MHRLAILSLVLLLSVSVAGPSSVAQEAATPAAASPPDLAAMTLSPSDLAMLDLSGYGLANQSSLRDAEADAILQADGDFLEAAQRFAVYQAAGFQARYLGSLLRPRLPLETFPSGLVAAESRISTAITQFATAEGAAAVFAFNEGPMDDTPGTDVAGNRVIGDESELTRSTGTEAESGEPLQRLELAFRLDTLIAEVSIVDYQNVEPDIAVIERLGETLLAKIERARGRNGPGLGDRALRLTPMAPWIESARLRDFYTRRDQTPEPTFAQIVAAAESGEPLTLDPEPSDGFVLPVDTYMFWTPIGEGDPLALPLYVIWLDRYQSPQQASTAISRLTDDLGPGYVDVQEFVTGTTIGDQSREFVYTYEGDPSGPVRGHLIISRVDDIVIRLQVDGPDGVRGSGVAQLSEAQAACLQAMSPCAPLSALSILASLVIVPVTAE